MMFSLVQRFSVWPCLLILLLLPLTPGFAQSSGLLRSSEKNAPQRAVVNQFEHLSVKNGLSDKSVNCILQDREGFLWFGTADGLNKYDGYTFTVLQQDPASPDSSLHGNNVSTLHEDRSGRLWATTLRGVFAGGGGLHQVDKRTGIATPVNMRVPSDDWRQTLGISEDRQGILWIGSWGGLIRFDPQTKQVRLYPSPQPHVPVVCSLEDEQSQFWVGTMNGLYQFDRRSGRFSLVPMQSASAGRQPWVSTLYPDKSGNLWAGTNDDGLLQIKPTGKQVELVSYAARQPINRHIFLNAIYGGENGSGLDSQLWLGTTEGLQQIDTRTGEVHTYRVNPDSGPVKSGSALRSGLSSDRIQAMYRDRAGTLWIGTDQGIDKQIGTSAMFTTIQIIAAPASTPTPPIENDVSALWEDHTGVIWTGSDNKKLYRYDPQNGQMAFVPVDPVNPDKPTEQHQVQTIYEDRSGQLWVSTVGALLRMDRVTGRFVRYSTRIRRIQSIRETPSGLLWLGGEGGIARFNPQTGQFRYYVPKPKSPADGPDFVEHILVSRTGDVWMAISGKGISRLHPTTGRTIRYRPGLPALASQLNDEQVTALYEAPDGVVWIGTNRGGLNRYEPATGRFTALTTRHGLPANHVSAIINDRQGHLWISTARGICRFNAKTKTFHTYTSDEGLPHNQFRSKVCSGRQGTLLFGSRNGVAIVHPDHIYNRATFPVYVTRLNVLDQTRPLRANQIELNHDENFISFDYVALSYQAPDENQYAHQLVGVDKQWVYSGTRHFANYSTLSPGRYTFRVKAANSDGIWNEQGASVSVVIRPPWWATWWAYGVYALAFGGAVFGFVQFRVRQARRQQAIELKLHKAEQLKAVDEVKTRFFSNITHEFRTPLSLIISPVEKLLQENRFDRPLLTLVHRNAGQLLRLINQLLDLSKLEGNYMIVSLMQGNVMEFANHIVAVFRRSAEQKGVTLTCNLDQLPTEEYRFDADKWEKILTNLLSNALKFTPAGGRVTLTLTPDWADGQVVGVLLQLADTGIGIAPQQLPHIFDRFYQADTSSTRAYEGTGIGLALVNELVDLLGGSIRVESQLGLGTTFRLMLPVLPVSTTADTPRISWPVSSDEVTGPAPSPALIPAIQSTDDESALPCVLVVEDNDELREFLVSELTSSYHVLQAADGEEGWALTRTELPDIVLTDVMMPRMDGNELTRLIRGHADTDHIAVVMLTAKAARQSRIDGLQHGADEYLAKPFSVEELHLRLHNLISRQQKLGEHYRRQFGLSAGEPTVEGVTDPFLNRIYALLEEHLNDSALNVDWLADQLATTRKTLYRKVQSLIQLTPKELIRQYRLRKAVELLRTGHTVTQTAELVGFKTPAHFTLVFREFYQQTPPAFLSSPAKDG